MTSILSFPLSWRYLVFLSLFAQPIAWSASLPDERPLWPESGWENVIRYEVPETVQGHDASKASLSGSNRVYRFVAKPTYSIHQAPEGTANGVGLVICPGGGFRELWLDREGHDLALWLKARGVTSLVLKYRTNTEVDGGKRKYPTDVYLPAVIADARKAIQLLRSQATELHLNPDRIGICGFSAGGALAVFTIFRPSAEAVDQKISGQPDFAGLFYPGLRDAGPEFVASAKRIPPLFIMNAIDDQMTPVNLCMDFYQNLLKAGAHAELHLFSKGGHGFDMGDGHGESVALWKESFIAWLADAGFIGKGKMPRTDARPGAVIKAER